MKEIRGISASPGISLGKAFLYQEESLDVPEYEIHEHQIPGELTRYQSAVERAIVDLELLRNQEQQGESNSQQDHDKAFLEAHILMLQDPELESRIISKINSLRKNIEHVLVDVINDLVLRFNKLDDVYFKERALDFHDVSRRVLVHLMSHEKMNLQDLKEEVILVTSSLLPSDAVSMNKRFVKGIAMDVGGRTTHTAIIARSFEIPAVLGTGTISREVRNGDEIIIDGNEGLVIIKPTAEVRSLYRKKQQDYEREESQLLTLNDLEAETRDGKLVKLMANIEIPEEVESVLAHGASGVGLYRSEYLFLKDGINVTEEVQYQAYRDVLVGMEGRPVTIRTLDLGGDKLVPGESFHSEQNPILGWRAVRFCLSHVEIFKIQLRALLRASVHGDLRIMFPMISGMGELEAVIQILEEVKADLTREGIEFQDVSLGTMIEVPSAALIADLLARKVDFFSIGTNDLIQYTLAVDRGNERIADLFEPFHPGVLRLIRMVIESGHKQGISVGMCGELAADPVATIILLGLGLDELSMNALSIPKIKKLVRRISFSQAEELVSRVMEMRTSKEIEAFVKAYLERELK